MTLASESNRFIMFSIITLESLSGLMVAMILSEFIEKL